MAFMDIPDRYVIAGGHCHHACPSQLCEEPPPSDDVVLHLIILAAVPHDVMVPGLEPLNDWQVRLPSRQGRHGRNNPSWQPAGREPYTKGHLHDIILRARDMCRHGIRRTLLQATYLSPGPVARAIGSLTSRALAISSMVWLGRITDLLHNHFNWRLNSLVRRMCGTMQSSIASKAAGLRIAFLMTIIRRLKPPSSMECLMGTNHSVEASVYQRSLSRRGGGGVQQRDNGMKVGGGLRPCRQ